MIQLRHTADEINSLRGQIQGDESEAYHIVMQMQADYHKIETNLSLAIMQAQQHAADATGILQPNNHSICRGCHCTHGPLKTCGDNRQKYCRE
jgi:hypothetical protein